jgi:galactonate dehydratase
MIDVPLAIGEEFSSKWQFLPYIERGITNFVRIDICNVGGFTEAMKVAGWAEAHYIDIMPHNPLGCVCTAASIHLCAAVANFCWLEMRPPYDGGSRYPFPEEAEVFTLYPELSGNGFRVPEGPGLGVRVDEDRLRRGEFRFWETPHLQRRDGSHTNW